MNVVRDKAGEPMLNDKGLPISEQIRPKEEYVVWEPGDPHESEIVRRIFELRVRYKYGYVKIAKLFNSEGIPCPQRGKWQRRDQKWSGATVGTIIRNPTYMGARVYNRLKKRGIGKFAPRYWVKDKAQWIIIEDSHPALVTPDQWNAANPLQKHSENGRLAITRFDSPYLLSGLIRCSHCGFSFAGKSQTIGTPGKRKTRRTYSDSGYASKGPAVCSFMTIDADRFEGDLLHAIKDRLIPSTITTKFQTMIDDYLRNRTGVPREEIEEIQTAVLKLGNQISSLITLAEKGIKLDEIANRITGLQDQKASFELKLKQKTLLDPTRKEVDATTQKAAEFVRDFQTKFEKAPISERKSMIRQFVDQIVIDRERRIAKCSILKIPKVAGKIVEELLENERTHLSSVPPTGFEPVFQA